MTSQEKLARCLACEPVNDRSEIPVLLQIITYAGVCGGVTQKEIHESNEIFQKALKKTYDTVGYPDSNYFLNPGDTCFTEALPCNRPGIELGDNELFQFVESENMAFEDYDFVAQNGWDAWYYPYLCRIQKPPITNPNQLFARFGAVGQNGASNIAFNRSLGVEPIFSNATVPPFDMFSLVRSFGTFLEDLWEEPDAVKAAVDRATTDMIPSTIGMAKQSGFTRVGLFTMRSDASVISPTIFDEFSFPSIKRFVEAFWEAGMTTVLHADGNWLPMLDRFMELPKNSVHFEFDGFTDLRKAYDIIGGYHSMRGDVGAVLLSYGKPDEVSEYCENLITDLGMKGGFMLGSGCEVPMSAKAENVKRIIESVRG